MHRNNLRVLVTGGSGFLGKAIIRELLSKSSPLLATEVRNFDIVAQKDIIDERLTWWEGDVRDYDSLVTACEGVDIVLHSAAIVDWGTKSEQEVYEVNVTGTEHVLKACREQGVSVLVFTSSLDAVYAGKPLKDIDEGQPYPTKHPNMYCRSKFIAEQRVLSENSAQLKTCALRPSDIYGEGDPYHIGSLVNMAKGGFYVRLGNGSAKCQHVYVGNVAFAHLIAAQAIWNGEGAPSGNVYFITDPTPMNFFHFFDRIIQAAGYRIRPKNLWIPRRIAYMMGSVSELVAMLLRPIRYYNPKFSRFAVTYTCTDFTFSSGKAVVDFNYKPKYSEKEAITKTIEHYRQIRLGDSSL